MGNSQAADTYGWDMAYSVQFSALNAAIAKARSSPAGFSQQIKSGLAGEVNVAASFGDWRLSGGSGRMLHMKLPLSGGTLKARAGEHDFSGSAEIEVQLEFLPQVGPTGHETLGLNLKTHSANPDRNPVVSILGLDLTSGQALASYIEQALETWLLANLQNFDYVLAVVAVNTHADDRPLQWLKPTSVAYAINSQGANPDEYTLGILAMTEGRSDEHLTSEVSAAGIPSGCNGGVLISQNLFLRKVLLPGIHSLFIDAKPSDFMLTDNGSVIRNNIDLTFHDFEWPKKKGSGTITITGGTIGRHRFTIAAQGSTLQMQIDDMHFPWPEFESVFAVHLTYNGSSTLAMDENHHLQMAEVAKPSIMVDVSSPDLSIWQNQVIIEGVGDEIASAAAGAMLNGALGAAAEAAVESLLNAIDPQTASATGSLNFSADFPDDADITNIKEVYSECEADAAEDFANASSTTYQAKFNGYFKRNWRKVLGVAVQCFSGGGETLPAIMKAYASRDLKAMPTLDQFSKEVVSPVTWATLQAPTFHSLTLNESLRIGIEFDAEN